MLNSSNFSNHLVQKNNMEIVITPLETWVTSQVNTWVPIHQDSSSERIAVTESDGTTQNYPLGTYIKVGSFGTEFFIRQLQSPHKRPHYPFDNCLGDQISFFIGKSDEDAQEQVKIIFNTHTTIHSQFVKDSPL